MAPRAASIVSRVLAGVLGAWAFTWGFIVLGVALLVAGGVAYDEAEMTLYLLAFVLYLTLFCWAFAARSGLRVWSVLAGGALLMTGAAWFVTGGA